MTLLPFLKSHIQDIKLFHHALLLLHIYLMLFFLNQTIQCSNIFPNHLMVAIDQITAIMLQQNLVTEDLILRKIGMNISSFGFNFT
jgi:hypothetical protein